MTTTKSAATTTSPFDVDFEAATERIRGLNEKCSCGEADWDHVDRHL